MAVDLSEYLGELVGAGGVLAVAVDAFEAGDGVLDFHAFQEGGDALGVAMATAREEDLLDGVADEDDVNLAGAHSDGDGRHEPPSVEEIVVGDLGFHSLLIGMPPVT